MRRRLCCKIAMSPRLQSGAGLPPQVLFTASMFVSPLSVVFEVCANVYITDKFCGGDRDKGARLFSNNYSCIGAPPLGPCAPGEGLQIPAGACTGPSVPCRRIAYAGGAATSVAQALPHTSGAAAPNASRAKGAQKQNKERIRRRHTTPTRTCSRWRCRRHGGDGGIPPGVRR